MAWAIRFALVVVILAIYMMPAAQASGDSATQSQSDILKIAYKEKKLRGIREKKKYTFKVQVMNCTQGQTLKVKASIPEKQQYVASVTQYYETVSCDEDAQDLYNATIELNVTVHGWFVGLAELSLDIEAGGQPYSQELVVGVLRKPAKIDMIFQFGMLAFVCLVTLSFGATLDLEVVKTILKRPIAVGIGLICQYTLMPLIAFLLGLIFQLNPAYALGLFAIGSAPGGGPSNIWSLLLGGSVDLSVTMTFFSSILCIATFPFWIYTLGSVLTSDVNVQIPFINIAITIMTIVIPLSIGILINRFLPRVSRVIAKFLKPVVGIFILFVFGFGMYSNRYIFTLMTKEWNIYVAGILLPNVGLGLACLVAFLCKQKRPFIITIGLEVAIQNTAVAIVFLQSSLPHPYQDLAIVMPIIASMFQPIFFITALICRTVYLKYQAKKLAARLSLEKLGDNCDADGNQGAVDTDDVEIVQKKLSDTPQAEANGKTV